MLSFIPQKIESFLSNNIAKYLVLCSIDRRYGLIKTKNEINLQSYIVKQHDLNAYLFEVNFSNFSNSFQSYR